MLFLSGGLTAGIVWQSARGTVTPWVVQVDKLGQSQAVAPALADYRPTDPQIAWHRVRFKVMRSMLSIRRIDGGSADGDDEAQRRGVLGISREAP